jgi:ketosteroid isomerase-like protein
MRTTTEVFEDHLAKRIAGDLEADIATNYAEDVVFLTGTGAFRGHEGVRKSAAELEHYLGGTDYEYNHTLIDGDYAFLEWTARSKDKIVSDGADGFVIKDGKIVLQTIHYSVTRDQQK